MNVSALQFESFGVSHTGCVRSHNEDSFLVEPDSGVWLVADGMGGHAAGEVASAAIVEHLSTIGHASSAPDLRSRFEDRLSRAHAEIRQLSKERGATIGSTLAALLAIDGSYACVWSGDSRVYQVRNGAIVQLSRDHTEVQELLDRGAITPSEARTWPRRNVITHAVGVTEDVIIDFEQGSTLPGDIFVLVTDGMTAHVSDREILGEVTAAPPREACESLINMVLARGGTDNATIIVVKVRSGWDAHAFAGPNGHGA